MKDRGEKLKTACFTGHRPPKINETNIDYIRNMLADTVGGLIDGGYTHFISGMAQGVDMLAAEIVLKFKEENPDISLECAVPCKGQENRWSLYEKKRYKAILSAADKVTVLSDRYTPWCMQQRNIYMVDNSDTVIAVFDGSTGGTFNTVKYAERCNKPVNVIDPGDEA